MSLVRLPFVFSAAIGFHTAVTSPNAPSATEAVPISSIREAFMAPVVTWGCDFLKAVYWTGTVAEVTAILYPHVASSLPKALRSALATLSSPQFQNVPITRTLVVGSMLATSGGLIRWLCYRELGRLFTFSLSFREGHKLVTTGPYSVVRHPSYTAAITCMVGICIMHGSRGSWLRESGVLGVTGVKAVILPWLAMYGFSMVALVMRVPKEDAMMRANFKDEWLAWVRNVKYRLIPGIY
ncbi:hypothetical protein BV22DRAFT_1058956 [Leucogyrophana mollusca]|uniref:Uncharacterized protein n=1 Tax=Leucogyrophana mollusca TaxID=85980 RepID=A0ACB8BSI4_9AGAM|nr:hypothetical protein BV22DRAFT_1058956 [Leucogyrophana mollusca]